MTFSKTDFLILELMQHFRSMALKKRKSESLRKNIGEQYFRVKSEYSNPKICSTPESSTKRARRVGRFCKFETKRC